MDNSKEPTMPCLWCWDEPAKYDGDYCSKIHADMASELDEELDKQINSSDIIYVDGGTRPPGFTDRPVD